MSVLASESLPIFLDAMIPTWLSIVLSFTAVLIGGEIIPVAVFTGPCKMQLAYKFSGLAKFFKIILYPVAFPLSRALDLLVGIHEESVLTRFYIITLFLCYNLIVIFFSLLFFISFFKMNINFF